MSPGLHSGAGCTTVKINSIKTFISLATGKDCFVFLFNPEVFEPNSRVFEILFVV